MPWDEKLVDEAAISKTPPSGSGRIITYTQALNEALDSAMAQDPCVIVLGQGVDDPGAMFGTTKNLPTKYGAERVFDTPVSEEGLMGLCVGAAMNGLRPVYMHNRPDFLLLTFNQLVTHAAKIHYMSNGLTRVPMVVWSAIGRGWGSGAQHSQSVQGLLLGVPGLKIVMPSTPYDAKGLMLAAIQDNNPVLFFEHRWLMKKSGPVPLEDYTIELGVAVTRRKGKDITVVGVSHAVELAQQAADELAREGGPDVEVIDLRTIQPLDEAAILASVKRTGRLIITDTGWAVGGLCAEIGCIVAEKAFSSLKSGVIRVALPDGHSPAGHVLENAYYPDVKRLKEAMLASMQGQS